MGDRRRGRELALQILFQIDLGKEEKPLTLEDCRKDFLENQDENPEIKDFAYQLAKGTLENLEKIDALIKERLQNWDFSRIATVDRNIIRAAVYELVFRDEIPVAVTINEAIEIAKDYSGKESSKFVNGILDKIKKDKDIIKQDNGGK